MPTPIATGSVHQLRVTVSDVDRSRAFYTEVVGFQFVMDLPAGVFLSNGAVGLGLGPSPDPSRAPANNRFDEARVGLDHLSFSVASRDELERARQLLDERGIPHGEITDLGDAIGLYIQRSAIRTISSWSSPRAIGNQSGDRLRHLLGRTLDIARISSWQGTRASAVVSGA